MGFFVLRRAVTCSMLLSVVMVECEQYLSVGFDNGDSLWDITAYEKVISDISTKDDAVELLDLSFSFPYFSTAYSILRISPNGGIHFDPQPPCHGAYHYTSHPITGQSCEVETHYFSVIFAMMADLHPGAASNAKVSFSSTDDKLTVVWSEVPRFNKTGDYSYATHRSTFRASLYPTGSILLEYASPLPPTDIAAVGLRPPKAQGQQEMATLAGSLPSYRSSNDWGSQEWGVYASASDVVSGRAVLTCPMPSSLCIEPAMAVATSSPEEATLISVTGLHFGCPIASPENTTPPQPNPTHGGDPIPALSIFCHFSPTPPPSRSDFGSPSFEPSPQVLEDVQAYGAWSQATPVTGEEAVDSGQLGGGAGITTLRCPAVASPEVLQAAQTANAGRSVHVFLSYAVAGSDTRYVLSTTDPGYTLSLMFLAPPLEPTAGGDGDGDACPIHLGCWSPDVTIPNSPLVTATHGLGAGWLYVEENCMGTCGAIETDSFYCCSPYCYETGYHNHPILCSYGGQCVTTQWLGVSECSSTSCEEGEREERKCVLKHPVPELGYSCGPIERSLPCVPDSCSESVACVMSDWHQSGACSASCGHGYASYSRSVIIEPRNGGQPCGAMFKYDRCFVPQPECPVAEQQPKRAAWVTYLMSGLAIGALVCSIFLALQFVRLQRLVHERHRVRQQQQLLENSRNGVPPGRAGSGLLRDEIDALPTFLFEELEQHVPATSTLLKPANKSKSNRSRSSTASSSSSSSSSAEGGGEGGGGGGEEAGEPEPQVFIGQGGGGVQGQCCGSFQ